jgi:hypothetical protein
LGPEEGRALPGASALGFLRQEIPCLAEPGAGTRPTWVLRDPRVDCAAPGERNHAPRGRIDVSGETGGDLNPERQPRHGKRLPGGGAGFSSSKS